MIEIQTGNFPASSFLHTSLKTLKLKMGLSAKEFHFYTWYRESLYRKWISMQILILKMPQTVILFKIASMILNKITVSGIFRIKICIEIHFLYLLQWFAISWRMTCKLLICLVSVCLPELFDKYIQYFVFGLNIKIQCSLDTMKS